jgi:hypothetical protein
LAQPRRIVVALACSLLLTSLAAAQKPAHLSGVDGVLSPEPGPTAAAPSAVLDAFWQGLRDLGDVEGQTILLEDRDADWQLDRLPARAADLRRRSRRR